MAVHVREETARRVADSVEIKVCDMTRYRDETCSEISELESVVDSLFDVVAEADARNEMVEIQIPQGDDMQENVSEALREQKNPPFTFTGEVGDEIDELIDQLEA